MRISFPRLIQFRKADEGQALVFVALGMMTLLLAAGLGVDVGYLHYQKEQMQKAADAGALAGASALAYSDLTLATIAAKNDTKANGFQDQNNGVMVTVHNPPKTIGDPFASDPNAVEVIVAQARPTFFMKVLGLGTVPVSARAVASLGSSSSCIFIMDPSDGQSFLVHGNVSVNSSCGIQINSTASNALRVDGASGSVTVSGNGLGIGVRGGYSCAGPCANFHPTPVTGIPPVKDPLLNYAAPNPGTCTYMGSQVGTKYTSLTTTNGTAVICGRISLTGQQSVTFGTGTYILEGGMSLAGGSSVSGSNVTFYVTQNLPTYPYSGISMTGNSAANLSAPTTGSLAGILFFQDRTIPTSLASSAASTFDGTNGSILTGALYFPTTNLVYKGNPSQSYSSVIVAWQIEFNGYASINNNGLTDVGSPAQSAIIVE